MRPIILAVELVDTTSEAAEKSIRQSCWGGATLQLCDKRSVGIWRLWLLKSATKPPQRLFIDFEALSNQHFNVQQAAE